MIFSDGLCGHFALGTLSKTDLKDAVFEITVFRRKKTAKNDKIQKCQVLHQNQKTSSLSHVSDKVLRAM